MIPISARSSSRFCRHTASILATGTVFRGLLFHTRDATNEIERRSIDRPVCPQTRPTREGLFLKGFERVRRFSTELRLRPNVIDFFLFPEVLRTHGINAPQGQFLK